MLIVSPFSLAVVKDVSKKQRILEFSALKCCSLAWFLYRKRNKASVVALEFSYL